MTEEKTPHIHAKEIKAWADGAKIQWRHTTNDNWRDSENPSWVACFLYRIKPEIKPDVVTYAALAGQGAHCRPVVLSSSSSNWNESGAPSFTNEANIKFTFDGETGKLKSAEVVA